MRKRVNYSASEPGRTALPRVRLLHDLGVVIRARRTERGMTIRELAQAAELSERYLVQVEGGEGNISVMRLEDLAEVLATSGAALLAAATPHAAEGSGSKKEETVRPNVIALVGLRGAGKSTVGKRAAARLGVPFVELDELIVREAQMTLATIFEIHGEPYYRAMEREVLARVLAKNEATVLATGGSIVTDPETWKLLRTRAQTIWLRATPKEHFERVVSQGDARPMQGRPRAMNELRTLLSSREPLYEQAGATVDTSRKPVDKVTGRVVDLASVALRESAPIGFSRRQ